ncbi:rab11 family-interacting protein 3 [Dorcoceras hygrometricum]|uniref:Rab11 family-interacting protein 3 n=1 Tax=Dorcoceras hygrometricum TaxID=472368 RepID=A0A2Z7C8U1_9LAMI|nr:rab11 family-interacting protein 3 [Dorcoceras hygrometricum]
MGFKKVYKCLQELFPQVDARALRAVAIEHSKDPDAAVEAVLAEIIPFFDDRSRSSVPLMGHSPKEAISPTQLVDRYQETVDPAQETSVNNVNDGKHQSFHDSGSENNEFFYDSYSGQHEGEGVTAEISLSQNRGENSIKTPKSVMLKDDNGINILQTEVSVNPERKGTRGADPEMRNKTSSDKNSCLTLGTLENVNEGVNQILNLDQERDDFEGHTEAYFTMTTDEENDGVKPIQEVDNLLGDPAAVIIQDLTMNPSERSVQSIVLPSVDGGDFEETIHIEDEFTLSESGGIQTMKVLDEIVADARNNKRTLFSTMESVVSMMREVELKEQVAEKAKEDASKGDSDVLDKAEELKQMLQYAKEANDMHAGEVYGEKAILATELRELQSRLLFLSEEKDKSLAILDEMHQILEGRLAAAESEIKSAEQEKMEKENFALKALAEHEMDMKKVLQEANNLKEQAEENAKLREFLMDRGCVVDMLQGEIAVICQDVRRLKENLDQRVPLSKSLSSAHTSFILASSGSSSKSSIQDIVVALADQDDLIRTPQNVDPATEVSTKEHKSVVEEDWDLL